MTAARRTMVTTQVTCDPGVFVRTVYSTVQYIASAKKKTATVKRRVTTDVKLDLR